MWSTWCVQELGWALMGAHCPAPGAQEPEAFAIWAAGEHNAALLLRRAFRVCSAAVELDC